MQVVFNLESLGSHHCHVDETRIPGDHGYGMPESAMSTSRQTPNEQR
jgi:hypothetical protein